VPFLPEVGTVVTAGMSSTGARHHVVRVHTDEGLVGLGEGIPRPTVTGETLGSIAVAIDELLAPAILGLEPTAVEAIWGRWERVVGNESAKASIDMALYDLIGQQAGLPLYKLLGGRDGRVPVSFPIAMGTPAEMARQAVQALEKGFKGLKIKVGKDVRQDIRIFAEVRRAIGDDVLFYVDANQGYTPAQAMEAIRAFEQHGIDFVEEPIAVWDLQGRARLARSIRTPLLLDESVNSPSDVLREIDLGTAGALSLRPPRHGVTLARKMAAIAEAANIPCLIGSHRELGIGTAIGAHVGAALRCVTYPAELGVHVLLEDGLLEEPIRIEDGYLHLPDRPGLGVQLDEHKLARYRL
jgi:L-alanine-DL-glutamate epimerase-like enolase superfamily enzyme